ncbi:hypothetical protein L596_000655 [Steinernema carpocapsae]|uniref:Uncharacterized protein n=1 Tax=Steinernema carpocapsae TaxID=34508 RepID=A0A4U8UL60_STECR|nr:hypothetical protein L596_000655 [Steinernema carpocapsae]
MCRQPDMPLIRDIRDIWEDRDNQEMPSLHELQLDYMPVRHDEYITMPPIPAHPGAEDPVTDVVRTVPSQRRPTMAEEPTTSPEDLSLDDEEEKINSDAFH